MLVAGFTVCLFLSLGTGTKASNGGNCTAIGGPGDGRPCILPFKWRNRVFKECTTEGGHEYWCSTKVDAKGHHVSGSWGKCDPAGCPGVPKGFDGKVYTHCDSDGEGKCIFPFHIDGTAYKGCLTDSRAEHGICMVEHPTLPGKLKEAPCSSNCPKDFWLTHDTMSFDQFIKNLMRDSHAFIAIKRDKPCLKYLNHLFAGRDLSKMPEGTRSATNLEDLLKQVCKNTAMCAGKDLSDCSGGYHMEKRKNTIVEADGARNDPKSDCMVRCASPLDYIYR